MKKTEIKIKCNFYTMLENIFAEQEGLLKLGNSLYEALKDVPVEELQKEFVSVLATLIHNENRQNNTSK